MTSSRAAWGLFGIFAIVWLSALDFRVLVKPDDLSRVNQAFFQVNGVVSIGLFLVVLLQIAVS